jgi:GxxExxY protein
MTDILFKSECYDIQGAVFEVYKELGMGFLEAPYQEALELELAERDVPFVTQKEISIRYKTRTLKQTYKADLICHDAIILELKAVKALDDSHRAQVHNYLKATGLRLGLLVNFGHHPLVEIERIVR